MKKVLMLLVAATLVAMAGSAMADTATIAVSAQVRGTCRFTNISAISFGDLPFDAAGNASGILTPVTGSASFWCTNGASYTITDDGGQYGAVLPAGFKMRSDTVVPREYIAYTFAVTSGNTTGTGDGPSNPITLNYEATVPASYTNNTPDAYSDTITLTITP